MLENINNNLNSEVEKDNSTKVINMFSKEEIDNKLAKFNNPAKVVQLFTGKNLKGLKFSEKNVERTNDIINLLAYTKFSKNKATKNFA